MDIETLFQFKRPDWLAISRFGFTVQDGRYIYKTNIMNGQFELVVTINKEGMVDTSLTDVDTGDLYVLHLVSTASGTYVGKVRLEYQNVMQKIADNCFVTEIFKSQQTHELISYVQEKYGDSPEYLWPKFPNNAVWRRSDNQKWYGAILTAACSTLGLSGDGDVEVLDIRIVPEELDKIVDGIRYLRGYHMNKKHWLTIPLDNTLSIDELKSRLDTSYELAKLGK